MHAMTMKPRFHSFRSFFWNVRVLGVCAWTRCAIENARNAILRRFRDP